MNLIRTATRCALNRLIMTPLNTFSGDQWKDRDEAAEKVYISRKESNIGLIFRIDVEEVAGPG